MKGEDIQDPLHTRYGRMGVVSLNSAVVSLEGICTSRRALIWRRPCLNRVPFRSNRRSRRPAPLQSLLYNSNSWDVVRGRAPTKGEGIITGPSFSSSSAGEPRQGSRGSQRCNRSCVVSSQDVGQYESILAALILFPIQLSVYIRVVSLGKCNRCDSAKMFDCETTSYWSINSNTSFIDPGCRKSRDVYAANS